MAAAPFEIRGIEKAFERVLISGAAPRSLVAQKMHVRDAAPLLKLLEGAADAAAEEGRAVWVLLNSNPVRAMANAAEILKIVGVAILPELYRHPTSNGHLNALAFFGRSLRESSGPAVAGGTFQVMIVAAATSLDNFITEARAQPATPYGKLRATIDELKQHFRSVADGSYTLRQPAPAAAAAN